MDGNGRQAEEALAHEILATVIDVVEYFDEIFGPYPLDQLQVVTASRSTSQGLLGFISLSSPAMKDWDVWGALLGIEDRLLRRDRPRMAGGG